MGLCSVPLTEGSASKVTFEEKDSEAFGKEVEEKNMEEVSKVMTRSMADAWRKKNEER